MPVILRIALRNLREHKAKSLIIMSLIALGMLLLVLGNSVIDTGKRGIEKSFIESFSGHILIGPKNKNGLTTSVFGTSGFGPGGAGKVNTIPEWSDVSAYLKANEAISIVNPQVVGAFQLELNEEWRAFSSFFGVDPLTYKTMFPENLELIDGALLTSDDEGMVLSLKTVESIRKDAGLTLNVGDKIKLSSFGAGTKIKVLELKGIVRFKTTNSTLEDIGFMDVSSLRYLKGMVVGSTSQTKIDDSAQNMLGTDSLDLDALFGTVAGSKELVVEDLSEADLENVLGDTSNRAALSKADSGAWQYALLRLNNGSDTNSVIKELNESFTNMEWNLLAVDWQGAAGPLATFVTGAQVFFLILVIILSIVSVIIIMNTMIVSINERTAEIGTMRALGATKTYIRGVFLAETMTLSVIGGLAGLVISSIILLITGYTGIPSPNPIFDIIFGGDVLYPVLSGPSVLSAGVIMLVVGFLSSLYPTAMALRIQPIKAMQS